MMQFTRKAHEVLRNACRTHAVNTSYRKSLTRRRAAHKDLATVMMLGRDSATATRIQRDTGLFRGIQV